jgi:WD40 repeat protein
VASLDEEGRLRIVELSGKEIAEHALDPRPTPILLTSPDQRRFAGASIPCAGYDVCPRPSDAVRGALVLGSFDGARPLVVPAPGAVRALAWGGGAEGLLVALHDGSIQKVTLDGQMTEIERLPAPAASLAVSADGLLFATGGDDGLVRVTDLASGARRDLGRHDDRVKAIAFAPGGKRLASGSGDHKARLWLLADGSYRELTASAGFLDLAFTRDGDVLFGASDGEVFVRRWSVASGEALPSFTGHTGTIVSLSLSGDGRRLLTGAVDRSARLFDVASGSSRALLGHTGTVVATAFAQGDKLLITLGEEGAVRAWPDDLPEDLAELRAFLEAATPDRLEGR